MKKSNRLIVLYLAIIFCVSATTRTMAQFNIRPELEPEIVQIKNTTEKLMESSELIPSEYKTEDMRRSERIRRSRERNIWEITPKLSLALDSYSNWAKKGVDDSFKGKIELSTKYTYKRSRFSYTNSFDGRLGITKFDTINFKHEDRFDFNNSVRYDINKYWSYTAKADLRSQFMRGYKSKTDKSTVINNFMSPGTLNVGLGFTWKPEWGLVMDIFPLSGNMIFVNNSNVAAIGAGGLDKGEKFKPQLGSALKFDFDRRFFDDVLRCKSKFDMFYNFKLSPVARWDNTVDVKVLKFFSTRFFCEAIYDREAMPDGKEGKIQFHYALELTFSHTFRGKK